MQWKVSKLQKVLKGAMREQRVKCCGNKSFNLGHPQVTKRLARERCPKSQRKNFHFYMMGTGYAFIL